MITKDFLPRKSAQLGFTLLELMITVAIVAILATIAIPSYRRYAIMNAESQAQSRMKQLEMELEGWRANTLSYKNFRPKKIASDGTASYAYDDANNTVINVPDSASPKYQIKLYANASGTDSLVTNATFTTTGNSWHMIAEPQGTLADTASRIVLNSKGLACKSDKAADSSFDGNITTCDVTKGAKQW